MTEQITLGDLGEREVVRNILPQYTVGIGDDCACIPLGPYRLIVTTDPVPEPAAKVIGGDSDLYWMGWLLVTINASDLAAAGAHPLAFVSAIEAPSALAVDQFKRFLAGVKEACESEGLRYVGGNLREGPVLSAVGTAIGSCGADHVLTRQGASVGDIVLSVGQGGIFWRDALALRNMNIVPQKDASPLYKPHSQLPAMQRLADSHLVVASIDNSDGLLPTLAQLSAANSLAIRVDLERLTVPMEGAGGIDADPARLWLGWGDWNVIVVVRPSDISSATAAAQSVGILLQQIGEFVQGKPQVLLRRQGVEQIAPRLESERFARDSWFSEGIEGYIRRLLEIRLPAGPSEKGQLGREQ